MTPHPTTYAGGAMRDAQVPVSLLFNVGAAGILVCAVLLLLVRPRPRTKRIPRAG